MKDIDFEYDLFVFVGKTKSGIFTFFKKQTLKYEFVFRKAHYYYKHKKKIRFFFWNIILKHYSNAHGFNLPAETSIGCGVMFYHNGPVTISKEAIIGRCCHIGPNVLIGNELRGLRKGAPIIGDNVWISQNAALIGHINVGSNVIIAPNTFVNFDVPSYSVVVGNPGIIHTNPKGTDGYVVPYEQISKKIVSVK